MNRLLYADKHRFWLLVSKADVYHWKVRSGHHYWIVLDTWHGMKLTSKISTCRRKSLAQGPIVAVSGAVGVMPVSVGKYLTRCGSRTMWKKMWFINISRSWPIMASYFWRQWCMEFMRCHWVTVISVATIWYTIWIFLFMLWWTDVDGFSRVVKNPLDPLFNSNQ